MTYASDLLCRVLEEVADVVDARGRDAAVDAVVALGDGADHLVDVGRVRGIDLDVVQLSGVAVGETLARLEEVRAGLGKDVEAVHCDRLETTFQECDIQLTILGTSLDAGNSGLESNTACTSGDRDDLSVEL